MKVSCVGCQSEMGEVRDARLKKGWGVICFDCRKEFTKAKQRKAVPGHEGMDYLKERMGMK